MKLIHFALIALLVFTLPTLAKAQTPNVILLQSELSTAICLNNWNRALSVLQQLIGSDTTPAESRQQLVMFRYRLEDYRASGVQIDQSQNLECAAAIAAEASQSVAEQHHQPLDWESALQAIANSTGQSGSITRRNVTGASGHCNNPDNAAADGSCFTSRAARARHNRSRAEGDRPSLAQN